MAIDVVDRREFCCRSLRFILKGGLMYVATKSCFLYTQNGYSGSQDTPEISKYELEGRIHQLTNIERARFGLNSLGYDPSLVKIARMHSHDMLKREFSLIKIQMEKAQLKGQGEWDITF